MTSFLSISLRSWALVVLSAFLQFLIFPIAGPVSPLRATIGWFALVPFLLAVLLPTRSGVPVRPLQAAMLGYCCGILWYAGNCYWIYQTMYLYGGLPKPVAAAILVLFALYLGLYHALFITLVSLVRLTRWGSGGALLLAPFAWVAVEFARTRITGFPWDLLGYSQIDNPVLTQLAPIAGVMGISFVLVAVNAVLAVSFFTSGKRRWSIASLIGIVTILLESGAPFGRHVWDEATDQLAIMMQDNLEVGEMARPEDRLSSSDEMRLFTNMTLSPQDLPASRRPSVIVWPEAPADFFTSDPEFLARMSALARLEKAPSIIGSLGIVPTSKNERGYYKYDSAALFDFDGSYRGHYDKIHLVPWGEYIPFKQFFSFAHKLTAGAGDMDPGTERSVFRSNGHSYGVFICYESIFGDEVRHFAANGAEVLVNISDDGWYGDTGAPWQHLNMTRMRAIENRRWLLLDTNTGITTSIDPKGRTMAQAPRHSRGAYVLPFRFTSETTFYTRHGDWFAWLCIGVVAIAFSLGAIPLPKTERGARPFALK
jgi:apolipoprotein N-acyltransferase